MTCLVVVFFLSNMYFLRVLSISKITNNNKSNKKKDKKFILINKHKIHLIGHIHMTKEKYTRKKNAFFSLRRFLSQTKENKHTHTHYREHRWDDLIRIVVVHHVECLDHLLLVMSYYWLLIEAYSLSNVNEDPALNRAEQWADQAVESLLSASRMSMFGDHRIVNVVLVLVASE